MSERSTPAAPAVSKLGEESRRWLLGSQTWLRVTSEQSGGSLAMIEQLILLPPAESRAPPSRPGGVLVRARSQGDPSSSGRPAGRWVPAPPDILRLSELAPLYRHGVLGPLPQ